MAITSAQYIAKVWYEISRGNPERDIKVYRVAIQAHQDRALRILADTIADAEEPKRALLQSSFSFTLDGTGSSLLSNNSTVIPEKIPSTGYVTLSGITNPLLWLPYRLDLDNPPQLPDYQGTKGMFYTIFNNQIVVRDSQGNIPAQTALTVYGSYVPTIAQVPDLLVRDLVNIGVALVMGTGVPPAPEQGPAPSPNPNATPSTTAR